MTVLKQVFPSLFFLFFAATAAECATQMTVDPATGLPSSITDPQITAAGVIAAPVSLKLRKNDRNGPELAISAVNKTGTDTYALTLPDPDFSMELKYGQTEFPYLEWSVENKSSEAKNCYATFAFTLPASADRSFFPADENAKLVLTQDMNPVSYAYGYDDRWPGARLALPLGQVYSAGNDWGLAFFGEYGNQIENLGAKVSRASEKPLAEISLNAYQLKAGEKTVRRLYFAVTQGDWRPALGALLVRYRQGLEPRNSEVAKLAPFVGGCLDPKWIASDDTSVMERWHREGGRAVEIHCTFPFYGQYVSEKEPWTGIVDEIWRRRVELNETWRTPPMPSTNASWQDVMAWVEQQQDFSPTMTIERINNYLERLHNHGMTSLIYWNPSDAWGIWANEKFPNDIVVPDGCNGLVTDNRTGCGMKHDKESAWGVYILNQLKEQLRIYPKADGVFFDIAADGEHNLTELCREACDYVHDKGKICWWNGPYNMELAALADGLMDEGGGEPDGRYRLTTEKMQYYGLLGKPIISVGQYEYAQYVVPGYAEMLVHGVTPQPISNNSPWLHIGKEQQEDIRAHWSPLFKWLRGRRWVLDAHALETTAGVEANIFRTPEDNLVVPVVPDPFPTDTSNPLFNVGVTVRLPDIGEVRGVYLLTPDLIGYHQIPFTLAGGVLQTKIRRLQKAGMLVLAKKGIFPAFQGGLELVRGQQGMLNWTVDNWTDQTKLVPMSLETPSGRQSTVMKVKPGKNPVSLSLPVTIPAENTESRFVITASAKVDGEELGGKMELWNDPPLLVLAEASDHIRSDEELTLTVQLLGHFATAQTVKVNVSSPGWQFDVAEKSVTLPQNQQTVIAVEFKGHPLVTGQTSIAIAAETEDQTVSGGAAKSVDVWGTTIPADLSTIESAELTFDSFGADGGEKSLKPFSINGALIGNVPSSIDGDQWYKGHVMQLPPAAVAALQQSNEIRIDNSVKDPFKIRNFQLKLKLQGGITAVSGRNSGVYTGCAGWAHGEGTQFRCDDGVPGEPLTGIMVNFAE
ncbi:MAG: hypothetical protein ACTFAK_12570 [Candidatus Electronema sp. VV]